MPAPNNAFFRVFANSFDDVDWDDPKKLESMEGNITVAFSDAYEEELNQLKKAVEARHLKIGKYINNGSTAFIFELKDEKNDIIPSVVLRIDPISITNAVQSAAVRWPLIHIDTKNGDEKHDNEVYYQASVMPRATRPEEPNPVFEIADLLRTLAVINTEEQLSKATDISIGQVMLMTMPNGNFVSYRDGKPVAVIADQNCMSGLAGLGGINHFCQSNRLKPEGIEGKKEDREEVKFVREQMDALHSHVRQELIGRGVVVDPIATTQSNVTATSTQGVGAGINPHRL